MSTTGGGRNRKPTETDLTTLKFRAEDMPASLDARNPEITVYHMWDESMVGVRSIDRESKTITFSSRTSHPAGAFRVKKYVVWNTREGIIDHSILKNHTKPDSPRLVLDGSNSTAAPKIIRYEDGRGRYAQGSPAKRIQPVAVDVSGAGPRND